MAVALITGCSSGFGLHTALLFARRGDVVVATVRDPARAGSLLAAAGREGLDVDVVRLDVTDPASVEGAVAGAVERHGRIDVLVNNAGLGVRGAVEDVPEDEVHAVFDTNVFGLLRVTRAVLPVMRAGGGGVVVNVSSVVGKVSTPFGGIYAATKHAVEAISDALHYEVRPFGIRVAVVEPGSFDTSFDANRRTSPDTGSPYAELHRRWDEVSASVPGRDRSRHASVVAEVIWEVATDPTSPLRRLVGDDAELLVGLRRDLDDAGFEHAVRTFLGFWDGIPGR